MDVVIPKDIVAATKMSEAQLKLEIAICSISRRKLVVAELASG